MTKRATHAAELVSLFNWAGVGRSEGHVVHENTDGRIKMKVGDAMVTANYFVFYSSDEHEAKHCLSLDAYPMVLESCGRMAGGYCW